MMGIAGPPNGMRFRGADPERAAQMRERFEARAAGWQAANPGATQADFHTAMRAGRGEKMKARYAEWSAANSGGSVEQFAQARVAERQQAMAARGIQVPQALEGSGLIARITGRLQSLLAS